MITAKYRRLFRVARATHREVVARGAWAGTARQRTLALIDTYRELHTAGCPVCATTPQRAASYRVRAVTARRGALAGAVLFGWLALVDLVVCALFGPARFNNGGW